MPDLALAPGPGVHADPCLVTLWTRDLDWSSLLLDAVLGSATGLVAALVPSWSIGRLTPVQALSGRFAVTTSEARAHRGTFWLTGFGVLVLALSGVWLSREFAVRANGEAPALPSPLPVASGGLGLLMLVAGVVWMAPYAVRRIASLGRLLPLTGRHAFRDAARHRLRTASAAVALSVTTGALVLATFAVGSAASVQQRESPRPPHSVHVDLDNGDAPAPDTTAALTATLERILGPVSVYRSETLARPGVDYVDVSLLSRRRQFAGVRVVDEQTLRWLVAPQDIDAALETYRAGGVVTGASSP